MASTHPWQASSHAPRSEDHIDQRAVDVLTLTRLSVKPDAVRDILRWLAHRTAGRTALIAVDGTVAVDAERSRPGGPLDPAARAVGELHRRGTPSAVLRAGDGGDGAEHGTVWLVRLGGAADGLPYLAVAAGPHDERRRLGTLLGDAARTLGLCWRLENAERLRRRVEFAEAHSREAVLHLLMIGSLPAAQRIAAALRPPLPRLARVYVIECPGRHRAEIAGRISGAARGEAWIVPCPVRPNHLIALVPDPPHEEDAAPGTARPAAAPLDELIASVVPECRVGVSDEVPLRDTCDGYAQAFHALAVARHVPEGHARFNTHDDVTALAGPESGGWARRLLAPCLDHEPPRRADPDGAELLATLSSWLTFGSAAGRHLKIHRNTLAARLRLIEELLGLKVTHRLADQSTVWLGLRLLRYAPAVPTAGPHSPVTLEELLAGPAATAWATAQLRPLKDTETVRAWLRADARIPATATALGLSGPGTRKRIDRAERALGRSLVHAPSAKYELWLAMRALGLL